MSVQYQRKNKSKSVLTALFLTCCLFILCLSCQPKAELPSKKLALDQNQPDAIDWNQQGDLLFKKAQSYWKQHDFKKSLKTFQTAYDHYAKISDKRCVTIQEKIAKCYSILNQPKEAERAYNQTLRLAKTHYGKVHKKVANINHAMALFYIEQGRYARAKHCIESALGIDDFIYGPVFSLTLIDHLNTQALVFDYIGDYKKAQSLYEKVYDILKRKWGKGHLITEAAISNLGGIYFQQKEYEKAEKFYKDALIIARQHKQKAPEAYARTLNNIAVLYKTLDDYSKAEAFYYSALHINEHTFGPGHVNVGAGHNNLAGLYIQTQNYEQAMSHLIQAWINAEMNAYLDLLWHVQDNFRDIYAMKNQPDIAIFFGKQAVQTIQNIKNQNLRMGQRLTQSFLKSKSSVFRRLADLLIDQGRLDEAQYFLKMLKEKEYLDFMGQDADRGSSVRKRSFTVFNPTEKKIQKVSAQLKVDQLKNVCVIAKKLQKTKQQWMALTRQLDQIKRAFGNFCKKLQHEIKDIAPDKHISFNTYLKKKNKLQGALSELGHGAAAIFFLKTADKLNMILTIPSISFARESIISTKDLNKLLFSFREKISYGKPGYLPEAQKLYSLIFGPIESDLVQHDAKIIMVSLDEALRYIPLGSLHDGDKFVAEKYAISIYTPAASMDIKDKPQTEWRAAGMGLTKALKGFNALPAVQKELDLIIQEADPMDTQGTIPGDIFINESFTMAAFEQAVFLQVPVIHIASHFKFQPGDVDTSFLLLGNGQELTLKTLEEKDFDLSHLDLLTLSACETAVSSRNADGKELESFGVMAQNKGAKSVIATLWPVADDSTGLFMEHFYRIHNENKALTKIEALQKVQQMFIHEHITRNGTSLPTRGGSLMQQKSVPEKNEREMRYTHPYYWAPFILIGNWL